MPGLPLHFGSHLPPVITEHKNVAGLNTGVLQNVNYTGFQGIGMKKEMKSISFIIFELLTPCNDIPLNILGEIKYIDGIDIVNFFLHFKMWLSEN